MFYNKNIIFIVRLSFKMIKNKKFYLKKQQYVYVKTI